MHAPMPLPSGTKLGPYEIQSAIGAGGMGEVYRGRDTRLDRIVAVKILPSHLSESGEARQRFDREARTISSVNHPNICTLYDVGHQDGIDYLVMEFLQGETLADRLRKGPLPIEQVLRYGIEICEGLDRAHRSGVVHRDLKPGNIMLTKTGAKLMDFGLAKASVVGADPASGLTATLSTPPGSQPLTAQGTVVGTFQYMAPEQVEGKEADARSDIFSLGAVLYEMVTGKRAFDGKTAASVMAAILEREPAPISSLQPLTPPPLESLVKTCLAKDPDERWQTAHDVKLQLRQISEGGSQTALAAAIVPPRKRGNMLPWIVAAGFGIVAAAALVMAYLAAQKPLPVLRVDLNPPEKTHFNLAGDNAGPAVLSPDGRYIVFSAAGADGFRLYLRPLDSVSSQELPGTQGATFPFWSPDSRSIAFFTEEKLKRIDVGGAAPVTICDSSLGRGGSWGPDGTIVAALSYNAGLSRVAASGGTPAPITQVDNVKYTSHRWPWILPDGKHFLYIAVNHTTPASPDTAVFFASLDGKENRLLFHTLSSAIYASGQILFMRENALLAQTFDPGSGKLTGDPATLREGVQYDLALWRANLSASENGMLAFASGAPGGTEVLAWFDRSGKQLGTVGEQASFQELALSPDDKKVAVDDSNSIVAGIWIYELGSNKPKARLSFNTGVNRTPVWSPDGRQVAFASHQQAEISIKAIAGGTPEETVLTSPSAGIAGVGDWSRDGRYLLFGEDRLLRVLPLFGDRKPYAYTTTPVMTTQAVGAVFSPDGRWVAYTSSDSMRPPEVFVSPFPWTGAKWQVSSGLGTQPLWRGDGKEIFYYDLSDIVAAEVDGSGATFQVGNSKHLFHVSLHGLNAREYGVTRDGQRFLAIVPREGSSQSLTLVQNWPAELKQR
jgi:Tol biopolymer transport system component